MKNKESGCSNLVLHRFVLEPWLVQGHLQLPVVKVRHPDGLGKSCILTFLHGKERKWIVIE